MLSCTREAAPKYVVDAPPGKFPLTLGHTGLSVSEYMVKCSQMARQTRVLAEIEADHLIVGSYPQAVQRILGSTTPTAMTDEEASHSLSFVFDAIDEATDTGFVNTFTVDTTSLVDLSTEKTSKEDLAEGFNEISNARALLKEYAREFRFSWTDGTLHTARLSDEDVMRAALQFNRSLDYSFKIYSHIRERMGNKPFGFELTLDELRKPTGKELVYYLQEWRKLGAHVDFIAPNIGFRKRADFNGNLQVLKQQLSFLAAVAHSFGALLSIHSGSGENPYGGKGKGVYQTILEATSGRVKYKISGVYFELFMDLLAKSKTARHKELFERILSDVSSYWEEQINTNTQLADATVQKMFHSFKNARGTHRAESGSRSEFFRHYSFVSLNLRDNGGKRYLKDELVTLYNNDNRLQKLVDREMKALTLRLIDGVKFADNLSQKRAP